MSKAIVSSLYDSDVFRMACRQFDKAADAINLPEAIRDRTKYPRRCLAVSLPVRRTDGSVTVFEGYRVQHNLSTGPSKGGIRFHQHVTLGGSQGRREATGAGVAYLVKKYLQDIKIPIAKATVAIQGFGNVGSETAIALAGYGAKIIAISDYTGGIHNPKGINIEKALTYI